MQHYHVPLERFGECFHNNACSHETIEGDARRRTVLSGGTKGYSFAHSVSLSSTRPMKNLPYFCSISVKIDDDKLYPKLLRASANSCPSIDPDRSLSKRRKTFCQSPMYLYNPTNSVCAKWSETRYSKMGMVNKHR